jgi:cobalt/nickel transport system permease protein
VSSIETGLYELGRFDQLSRAESPVHRLDPRAKVIATLFFLVCVVSLPPYDLVWLAPFVLFPVALASAADLPLDFLGSRLLIAAPFALVVGAFNPLLDHTVVAHVGGIAVTGGWVSYASIVARFLLTTSAALVLVGTTGMSDVCLALERLGVPDVIVTQLLFLYRYIFVLAEEAMRMARARSLRSFDGRGTGLAAYGSMLGQLLLRTLDRAQRVYGAMQCRGFTGRVHSARTLAFRAGDWAFMLGWSTAFVLFRLVNVPLLLGGLLTKVIG